MSKTATHSTLLGSERRSSRSSAPIPGPDSMEDVVNPVFTLEDLQSVGSIPIYEATGLRADVRQEDIPSPPDGASPELLWAFAILSDPGTRLGYEILARGYREVTRSSVLMAGVLPWHRLMRGVALLRDAEDAEARNETRQSLRAWEAAEHDLARGRIRGLARALQRMLHSWGLDRQQAAQVAGRVGRAIGEELLPLAHLRAFLRRPPSDGEEDSLHLLHLEWMERVPRARTEEFALAGAMAIHLQLDASEPVGVLMSAFFEVVSSGRLEPEHSHALLSHVARRIHARRKTRFDWLLLDHARDLWEVTEAIPPSLELARCVASLHARMAIDADHDHDQDQLEHALWSLALDPRGEHEDGMRELVDTIVAVDPSPEQPMSAYAESFMASEVGEQLTSYWSAAILERVYQRLGAIDEAARAAVRRVLMTLDAFSSSEEPTSLSQAIQERLGPTCGLEPEQWDVLAPCLDTLKPGDGAGQLAWVLRPTGDIIERAKAQVSTLPTGSALARGGLSGPPLRRWSYVASLRDGGAKLMAVAGVAMILHGSYVGISDSIRTWTLDSTYERATEAEQRGDHQAALVAALEFLETDDETLALDPRHEWVSALAVVSARSRMDVLSDSSDGYASLSLLEDVVSVLSVLEFIPELQRQVDQVVLDQVSELAVAGEDAEVDRLLARRAEVVATLSAASDRG